MKYKLLGSAMVVLILVCALAASVLEAEEGPARIHQRLSARGPDAGCGCDGAELCTHLPLVIIDTGGQEIPGAPVGYDAHGETIYSTTADGESMLSARISILDNETRNHHPSDTPDLESAGLIRIRGRSSRYFDKHNYLLRFTDDDGAYAATVVQLSMYSAAFYVISSAISMKMGYRTLIYLQVFQGQKFTLKKISPKHGAQKRCGSCYPLLTAAMRLEKGIMRCFFWRSCLV